MICWKIRIFAYWTTPVVDAFTKNPGCDLLKNSYLCLLNNTLLLFQCQVLHVVICWKIRIFAYWTTPPWRLSLSRKWLWFAEKFVSLLIEQHPSCHPFDISHVVICWKIRIFAYWTTPVSDDERGAEELWFAEKFVSLLIEQHLGGYGYKILRVVICWKIRIFAYWTTPERHWWAYHAELWFAEKFVSLLIEQHLMLLVKRIAVGCDLLKNSYLCLLNNTAMSCKEIVMGVVICWKIRIFAYWTTPEVFAASFEDSCDLLKNSYLCLLNNTLSQRRGFAHVVVICWKIRIFAYWTTPI